MPEQSHGTGRPVPPLPSSLTDLRPLVFGGTLAWFAGFVVLWAMGSTSEWRWISLAGGVLGLIGTAISEWQRGAARRGAKGAQSGF